MGSDVRKRRENEQRCRSRGRVVFVFPAKPWPKAPPAAGRHHVGWQKGLTQGLGAEEQLSEYPDMGGQLGKGIAEPKKQCNYR